MRIPFANIFRLGQRMAANPRLFARTLNRVTALYDSQAFTATYAKDVAVPENDKRAAANPLWEYFQGHIEGPGIWKWEHYFEVYHHHFARFIGRKVNILEIGIYSGGSLGMWRSYFGNQSHIFGVDIEPACKVYENEYSTVLIGDQADRNFWKQFRNQVTDIDIIIDDGGHTPEQQRITLEEMLPSLRPGGVYVCEDIHGYHGINEFSAFASGLVHNLNTLNRPAGAERQSLPNSFQASIHSIHFYPYMLVIEKRANPLEKLSSLRHGTEWQPFL